MRSGGKLNGLLKVQEDTAGRVRDDVKMEVAKGGNEILLVGDRAPAFALTCITPQTSFHVARPSFYLYFMQAGKMNTARILKMAPFRAAAMRQPVVRQAFQRQARPFHNTRTMFRTKVCHCREHATQGRC